MDYCGPAGIPHSHFLGGPLVWHQDDRDKALVWQQRHYELCQSCGTRHADFDPEQGGHPRAFVATIKGCPGCATIENARERMEKKVGPGDSIGLRRQVTEG